ncbi:nicotinic acid plasma membrane transporter [Exophiala viscosa]|uniref:Nicotinic acid plasma membrane transporter n=2 Tax=Exophiala viscosa TaxID=2486360 RepID=A0AAN6E5W0_9EURO|nr:nicotinic acid plasma membrane transporter [Exophiala viscosa]
MSEFKSKSIEDAVHPIAPSPIEVGSTYDMIDPKAEKKLIRKMDLHIVPLIVITYILSYLDRTNIGNAKIAGMPTDIHLHGTQINLAVSIFYVTYIIFEIPITLLVRVIGPSRLIPCILVSWSLVTAFSGFVSSPGSLIACRLLLGMTEAALFPILNLYVTLFWKREEIAKRAAGIFIAIALSGAFGGLFAGALTGIDVHGYHGWRWLYFTEGIVSFCWAIASFFLWPDSPDTAYFLNAEEKQMAKGRIEAQAKDGPFEWSQVTDAFKSPICWLSGFIQMCADTYNYSISTFLPTIIKGLGYTSKQTQYHTIPIYLVGAVAFFGFAWLADRTQRRAPIMLFFPLFTMLGYAILLGWNVAPGAKYFACFLIVTFGSVLPGLNITWLNGNMGPRYKRATALAMNQTIGNFGGIICGQIYLDKESPRFVTGQAVALSCCCLSWSGVWVMWWMLKARNDKRDEMVQAGQEDTGKGDESIYFRYQL